MYFHWSLLNFMDNKEAATHFRSSSEVEYRVLAAYEVEYRALAATTRELQWIMFLFRDLQVTCAKSFVLSCDTQSVLHIVVIVVDQSSMKE